MLDHDSFAEYDLNNGLLLSKSIDDYFDKFLLTFDSDGKMIFSDAVPEEIQDEFKQYQLDSIVYNSERQKYMEIHRSLFYYKNYYEHDDIQQWHCVLDNITVPFYDCGLRILKDQFIVLKDDYWMMCPTTKLKQEFIERTGYIFKYCISNVDFATKLLEQSEYRIDDDLTNLLNCPNMTVDVGRQGELVKNNPFKISITNFNVGSGVPEKFLSILFKIFDYNTVTVTLFRDAVHSALIGKGGSDGVILYNDLSSIDLLMNIIKKVVGNYFLEYKNTKILYRQTKLDSIPNCSILYFKNHKYTIDSGIFTALIENSLFPTTILNCNKYVPFISVNSKEVNKNLNARIFKCFSINSSVDINELIKTEGADILNWFVRCENSDYEQVVERNNYLLVSNFDVDDWLKTCCELDDSVQTPAKDLYANYLQYCKDVSPQNQKSFFMQLRKSFRRVRKSSGQFYIGIKLK